FEVYAVYEGEESNTATFEVFIPKRKVVLEDYTGDWCGWCPRALLVVDEVQQVTDDVVVLSIHVNDVMEFPQYQQLFDMFDINSALPRLYMNRTQNIAINSDSDIGP